MGGRPVTIEVVQERIRKHHGDVIVIDPSTFINQCARARFIHKEFGEWWTEVRSVTRGSSHPLDGLLRTVKSRKISAECLQLRLPSYLTFVPSSFKGVDYPCLFIDSEFGEKWMTPTNVLAGHDHPKRAKIKRENTNKVKYGYISPLQCRDVALKTAKSLNSSCIKKHWKTNEELICVGSYEAKVVEYLNKEHINFEWQPRTFSMPDGRTYRPDLYLVDQDLWVEIKGYMRKDAQEKWDWFHGEHPNSELWNKEKLKRMGIL